MHNKRHKHCHAYALAFAALTLAGCAVTSTAPKMHTYQLAITPSAQSSERLPVVVTVAPVQSAALYDGEAIVYRDAAWSWGNYHYHRWAVRPARLLGDLLTADLVHSQRYKAVAQAPSSLASDYVVHVSLDLIEEARVEDACAARLQVSAVLTRTQAGSDPIVYQKIYSSDQSCPCRSPAELVAAMGAAATRVLQELQADLSESIAAHLPASHSDSDSTRTTLQHGHRGIDKSKARALLL